MHYVLALILVKFDKKKQERIIIFCALYCQVFDVRYKWLYNL